MINPKPRFGYDEALDKLYDYQTNRNIAIGELLECPDGVWNTEQVKELILAGKSIEPALTRGATLTETLVPEDSAPVEKFKSDADAVFATESGDAGTADAQPAADEPVAAE